MTFSYSLFQKMNTELYFYICWTFSTNQQSDTTNKAWVSKNMPQMH